MMSRDLGELVGAETAGGERRRADAHARRHHRRAGVEGHGVAVHRDAHLVEEVLGLLAVDRRVAQVHEHEVHVGAAGDDVDARLDGVGRGEALGDDARALEHALLPLLELLAGSDLERDGLGGDDVHERPALLPGEHRRVELLREFHVARHDEARAGATEGLVDGRGDHVGVGHGAGVQARGHQAREVRHVRPQLGAHLVGDLAERREVEVTGVRGPAGDDHVGTLCERLLAHLLHLDAVRLARRGRRPRPRIACRRS